MYSNDFLTVCSVVVFCEGGSSPCITHWCFFSHVNMYVHALFLRIDWHGAIKVADFGLTEDMYGTNYFRRRKSETGSQEKVPIRWMAPESIENDVYNESTDVVSIFSL